MELAVNFIQKIKGIKLEANSENYITESQDNKALDWFHNQVIKISCSEDITPEFLLKKLLEIEANLGRIRKTNNNIEKVKKAEARVIDLDLLLFDNIYKNSIFLNLPHPRMKKRAFVLVPLLDVAPELEIEGESIRQILNKLSYLTIDNKIIQS